MDERTSLLDPSKLVPEVVTPVAASLVLPHSGDAEPLVRIRFSDQAKAYMDDASLLIAKAMVEAGIKAINDLGHPSPETATDERPRQLH